jgi:hypothetical protein
VSPEQGALRLGRDPSRLVFVAGLHRSGTTPLARALARHTGISGLSDTGVMEDEGQHLQSVYPPAYTYGGPGRFAWDERSHLTEASPLVTPRNAARLWEAWEPYWDLDRRLLLEKSPPNLVMGRFLQALFPGCALVVVMRHPVIVALSTVKWRRLLSRNFRNHTTPEQMVGHWLKAHQTFLDDLPALDRVVVLRYEELVADPTAALGQVADLLGLDSPVPADGLRASHSTQYEQRWHAMSRSVFDRHRRRRIEERYGEAVARFGYDIASLQAVGGGVLG